MSYKVIKKGEKEENKKKEWKTEEDEPKKKRFKFPKIRFPKFWKRKKKEETKKYRVPFLLRTKRILAATLLFLNFGVAVSSVTISPISIMFFATSFIMLDYLWKTKKSNLWRE